jgi:septation ring formation regulator EzrA
MRNERLLQYIASLSDEEREKYRDLIEEALQRDRMLAETLSAMKTCIKDLAENLRRFREETRHLQVSLSKLNDELLKVMEVFQVISKVFSNGPVWN